MAALTNTKSSGDLKADILKILKSYLAENKLNFDIWQFPTVKRAIELNLGAKNENEYQVINL